MKTSLRRAAAVTSTLLVSLLVLAPAALAASGEHTKIEVFDGPREVVGMIFLGGMALATALAVKNAVQQLGGKRDAASGKWRWR